MNTGTKLLIKLFVPDLPSSLANLILLYFFYIQYVFCVLFSPNPLFLLCSRNFKSLFLITSTSFRVLIFLKTSSFLTGSNHRILYTLIYRTTSSSLQVFFIYEEIVQHPLLYRKINITHRFSIISFVFNEFPIFSLSNSNPVIDVSS